MFLQQSLEPHSELGVLASLQKQMKFLEQQQEDNRSSKEEARQLRNKLRTMER